MSEVATAPGAMDFNDKPSFIKGKGIFTLGGLVGGLGLWGYLAFGSGTTHEYALNSYIYGYIFWLMVTLGCLGLSLLHNSIKSSWTLATLRIFEAGASWQMFAALFFFFIPVLMHLHVVYEWADPAHLDFVLKKKAPYLNQTFFTIRLVAYFLIFGGMSAYLRASTNRHDKSQDPVEFQKRTNFATPCIGGSLAWHGACLHECQQKGIQQFDVGSVDKRFGQHDVRSYDVVGLHFCFSAHYSLERQPAGNHHFLRSSWRRRWTWLERSGCFHDSGLLYHSVRDFAVTAGETVSGKIGQDCGMDFLLPYC